MMTWVAEFVGVWAVALFLAADGVRWCWSPCVMCCAVLCVGFGRRRWRLASRCAALMAAVCKLLAKDWPQGVGLGWIAFGCKLGTYSSCRQRVLCNVQDGCG